MTYQISRSQALQTIPQRKIVEALEQTIRNCPVCSLIPTVKIDQGACKDCIVRNKAIKRYAEGNIPVRYWFLEMDKSFTGDEILIEKYKEITKDLRKSYQDGVAYCFAGNHGLGKTMANCNILKRAVEKGYSALYVNLSDIVSLVTSPNSEDRNVARRELLLIDYLVIDEFDPRYMPNEKSSELFGKVLEEIFRTRHQNALPILMCTNSPNVVESFSGSIKQSITSLMSCVTMVAVLGKDFRIHGGK